MSETIANDEAAELAALTQQMGLGDAVKPGGGQQEVPIPQYEPLPSGFGTAPEQPAVQPQQQQPGVHFGQQQPMAPVAAVVDERRKRQQAEADANQIKQALEQQRASYLKLEERVAMMGDVMARGQQQQLAELQGGGDQIPAYEDDPEAHIREMNRRAQAAAEERLKKLEERQDRNDQIIEQETIERQIKAQVTAQASQFQQQVPDFRNAYEFYIAARKNDLIAQGFAADRVAAHVDNEEMIMAQAHLQDGRSIPEAIYNAAISRGYRPGQAPAPQGGQPGNGAPAPGGYHQAAVAHAQPGVAGYGQAAAPGPYQATQQAPAGYPPQYQAGTPQQLPYYYQAPALPAPQQPVYSGQPSLDNMQAGMMSGSHLAQAGQGGVQGSVGFPTLDQLGEMSEEQLMQGANMKFLDAHIQGLQNAGH